MCDIINYNLKQIMCCIDIKKYTKYTYTYLIYNFTKYVIYTLL